MSTDYRALCAELLEATQSHLLFTDAESTTAEQRAKRLNDAMTRARTALAQPEPMGPTPIPCDEITPMRTVEHDGRSYLVPEQPEPVGPSDNDLLRCMIEAADSVPGGQSTGITDWEREAIAAARAVLARWGRPAITPIPVSERLPGVEDCDAEGRCWWLAHAVGGPYWHLWPRQRWTPIATHWLPFHALPLPLPPTT